MKLPPFDYRQAHSRDEAVALLAEYGEDAKILAGGQSLIPLLAIRMSRPEVLIDINPASDLAAISTNGDLVIGALTRHRVAETSEVVRTNSPMLTRSLGYVGHVAIRTRGTLGGSAAHADPAAELPTVLTALGGSIEASSSRGVRTIDADTFFEGFLTTTLEYDELLSAIRIPLPRPGSGWAFNEFSRRSGDFALVGVAASVELDGGNVTAARIALSGVATEPVRALQAEAALIGSDGGAEAIADAASAASGEIDPSSDLHGTGAYRKYLAGTLVKQTLREAVERAQANS